MLLYNKPVKLAFHGADTDTDTDILARIVASMSACRSACHRNNFNRACRTCRRGSSRGCRRRRRGIPALVRVQRNTAFFYRATPWTSNVRTILSVFDMLEKLTVRSISKTPRNVDIMELVKSSPITERWAWSWSQCTDSQPAGDFSHPPGGMLPLLSASLRSPP